MGRVFKPEYSYTKADGTRVKKQTDAWYIQYQDANGRCIRRKAGLTKEQASAALTKAESDVLSEKNGLPTQRVADIQVHDLAKRFLAYLKPRVTNDHWKNLKQRLTDVLNGVKAYNLRAMTPESVERYISALGDRNLSPRTVNYYFEAPKRMLNWAVRARIIPYNPLDCIAPLPETERRHVRRALSEEEITSLLAAALDGPIRRKLRVYQNRPRKDGTFKRKSVPLKLHARLAEEGRNNVLAYRIMLETGLRRSETRSITWADVDLDAETLTTRPHWEGNKNGREETLPLTPGLHGALKAWREGHPGSANAAIVKISDRLLRCFDDDLVAARLAKLEPLDGEGNVIQHGSDGKLLQSPTKWKINKRDAAGRVLDLHALRHTFGTRLGRMPNVDLKSVQTLMRHSDPRLTFGIYVHSDKARLKAAMGMLP